MGFLSKILGVLSGSGGLKVSEQLLFDKVIGFKGIVPGVGTSTIVQNVAIALSNTTKFDICVLDTNFLYPTQYPLLIDVVKRQSSSSLDYIDFTGDISAVTLPTKYSNVYLAGLDNRGLVDLLSSRDSDVTLEKVIGALKSYFDIILVDLSHELSSTSTAAAVKCNRIFMVADQSIKCLFNLNKSLNMTASLAVPFAKANSVILNKVVPDLAVDTSNVLKQAGLNVVGEIPLSLDIAKLGVIGKKVWGVTTKKDIGAFNDVIKSVLDEIVQQTPLNESYIVPTDTLKASKTKEVKNDDLVTNIDSEGADDSTYIVD